MSEGGVTVTVAFAIKPELAEGFVDALRGMFPETPAARGAFGTSVFLRSEADPSQFPS